MNTHLEDYLLNGYTIAKSVIPTEMIEDCRKEVLDYIRANKTLINANGNFIPDFVDVSGLQLTANLRNLPQVHQILSELFQGVPYRFCGHSDVAVNRVVSGWHKDILNGPYVRFQKLDPWSPAPNGDLYTILKVAVYLEDHSNNMDGLQVVPGSHLKRGLETGGAIRLKPVVGDVIFFDQRITHRGMERQIPTERILISFGFGAENQFTDNFEAGTRARQFDQLRSL